MPAVPYWSGGHVISLIQQPSWLSFLPSHRRHRHRLHRDDMEAPPTFWLGERIPMVLSELSAGAE